LNQDLRLAGDYSHFVRTWEKPGDGIRGFLLRFLASKDEIDQHIAVWTLSQLLESQGTLSPSQLEIDYIDRQIQKLIRHTPQFQDLLRNILRAASQSTEEAIEDTDFEDETDEVTAEEGNEVINLARSALSSLKKLPPLEELEGHESTKTVVEEQVPAKGKE